MKYHALFVIFEEEEKCAIVVWLQIIGGTLRANAMMDSFIIIDSISRLRK